MIKLLSIADVISLINACFGFLAVLILFSDIFPSDEIRIRLSFSFILLALLADGLDGIIARRTRTGELGEYLEAMADMISLGIAPSVFVYTMYHDVVSRYIYYQSYIVVVLIVFLSLSIIRLASFHI
ncbi:MAG: CDP-alcohol phosphatidyltransferase family protein, partial [Thermoplasmatales archaeon]|nr:CDP-alcohol phosphatidyltransferase family protein [Thermoplasmatales archaeon]